MTDDVNLHIEVITTLTEMGVWRLRDGTIVVSDESGFRTITRVQLRQLAAATLRAKARLAETGEMSAIVRDLRGRGSHLLDDKSEAA